MNKLSDYTQTHNSEYWQKIFQAPREAYRLVEAMRLENPCLQTEVGKDALYHIRRAAVDYFLYRIAKETPAIHASFQYNKAKNCRHVELRIDSIYLTASFVSTSSGLPRHAIFRDNLIRQNLLLPFYGDENEVKATDTYFILTYGGQDNKLDYVSLKYPYADGGLAEIELPTNITAIPNDDIVPVENTESDILIEIKKEFQDFSADYEKQG